MNIISRRNVLLVLFCAVVLVAAVGLRYFLHPPLHLQAAQLLPAPKPLDPIELNYNGSPVRLDGVHGSWALVFLGYLSCPDVCPLEMQKLGQMLKYFDAAGIKKIPTVAFVSVDPERDTGIEVKSYAEYFDARMIGATGTNAELGKLAQFFGAAYNRQFRLAGKDYLVEAGADMPPAAGDDYEVNHSSRIFIIDPQGRYVGSFAPPHDAAILFSDMKQLVEQ